MSSLNTNQVQGLMEAYQAVYDPDLKSELEEEQLEIEELGLQIIENAADFLFSQGYDVNDLIDYFSEANENVISEDAVAISEGVLLVESVVSDEYIEEQFEILNEGLVDSGLKYGGKAVQALGRLVGGAGKKVEALGRLKNIQNIKAAKAATQSAGATMAAQNSANIAKAAKTPGMLQRAGNWAKGKLSNIPGAGALGRVGSKAIPLVGAGLYGVDAARRFKKGDWGGGLMSTVGGLASGASAIPAAAPIGGAIALGTGLAQMGTDAMGLTGDKSLKNKSGAKLTPSSTKWNASKALGGKAAFSAGGGTAKMKENPKMSAADVQRQGMTNIRNKKPPTTAPAAPTSSGSGGGGRAPSTPATPRSSRSSTPATPKPETPKAQGTPMQQWARANPTLASKVKVGQSGYDEISQIRDKPGPNEKQDQTPTQGPTPSASQQSDLNKTGYAAPEPPKTNAQSTMNNAEQERKKREKQRATTESYDAFDLVLDYLINEGHVDSIDEALYVMMEMDGDEIMYICEAYQEPRFKRKDYLKKISKRGGMGMGTPDDPHGYRDPGMAKVGSEFSKRKTAAKKAKQTGEPDTYRSEREAKAAANRARGAARRGEG